MEGAAREAKEEACAGSEDLVMHSFYNIRHVNQVYILYRGTLKDGRYGVGQESNDARLYSEAEIPWGQVAFPVIKEALRLYFEDRSHQTYGYHEGDIYRDNAGQIQIIRYAVVEKVFHAP